MNEVIYATSPWNYCNIKPPKRKCGRPKTWDTQQDIDFCLNHCPHPNEKCTGNVKACKRYKPNPDLIIDGISPRVGEKFTKIKTNKYKRSDTEVTHIWSGSRMTPLSQYKGDF